MTKVLVTGAAGFIGSHVVDWCLRDGMTVVALDDLSGGSRDNVSDKAEFVHGSIVDHRLIAQLFEAHHFDYVYHLAAYAAEGLSHFIRRYNYENNLIGSVNLINQSIIHKIKCFVFTSSIAVYGANQLPMKEDMIPQPEDPYGVAKYAVELDLKAAKHHFGLEYIVFRPHNVYGERQNIGDKYRNVVGILMNQILQGKPLTIFGDGNQTRAFSYIDDVAPVIARSIYFPRAYGQVFNVGGDVPYTVNHLVQVISGAMKVEPEIHYLRRRNEVEHAFSAHDKAKEYFDISAPVALEQGITRMLEWVYRVGARKTENFAEIEIHEGLPEGW